MSTHPWWKTVGLGAAALALLGAACSTTEQTPQASPGTSAATTDGTEAADADGQVTAFCDEAEANRATIVTDEDFDPADDDALGEFLDAVFDVGQYAPEEIQRDWDTVSDAFQELYETDPEDRLDAATALALDEDLAEAMDAVDAYLEENCGFTFSGDDEDDDGSTGTTLEDDDGISIDALQAYLDDEYSGAQWVEDINSWSTSTFGSQVAVTVGTGEAWDTDTALTACEAVGEWVDTVASGGEVSVYVDSTEVVVRESAEDGCAAV